MFEWDVFLEIFVTEIFYISKVTEYCIFEYDVCEKHESNELGKNALLRFFMEIMTKGLLWKMILHPQLSPLCTT